MFYIIDTHGTTKAVITEPIYQGSVGVNNIVLLAPFPANAQITVSAYLPNGIPIKNLEPLSATTYPQGMPELKDGSGNAYTAFSGVIDQSLTAYAGTVQIQFSVFLGIGKKLNTYTTSFVVSEGVVTEPITLPNDEDYLNAVLQLLAEINADPVKSVVYSAPNSLQTPTEALSVGGAYISDGFTPEGTTEFIGTDKWFYQCPPAEGNLSGFTLKFNRFTPGILQLYVLSNSNSEITINVLTNGTGNTYTQVIPATIGQIIVNPRFNLTDSSIEEIQITFDSEEGVSVRAVQVFSETLDGEYIITFKSGATATINASDGEIIKRYSTQAQQSASAASGYSIQAQQSASQALQSASSAQQSAETAQQASGQALAYADDASASASSAQQSAEQANQALQTVLGRRTVFYEATLQLAIGAINTYSNIVEGDMLVIGAKDVPDLIVFSADSEALSNAPVITQEQIGSQNIPDVAPGSKFIVANSGKGFVAIESGIDTSDFISGEEFNAVINGVYASINSSKEVAIDTAKSYTDEKIQGVSGGASKPKTYTLIEERTLTQDESVVEFTALNLSSFYIEIMGGFVDGTSSTLYMDVNEKPIQGNTAVKLQANLDRGIYIRCVTENDGCIVSQVTDSASGVYKPFNPQMGTVKTTLVTPSTSFYNSLFPFKTIKLYTLMPSEGTQKWLNGSNFKLWGIENDNN